MATKEQLAVEAALDLLLLEHLSTAERETVTRWGNAWDSIKGELEAALIDLAQANEDGRVTRTQILNSYRLQAALDAMTQALGALVADTTTTTGTLLESAAAEASRKSVEMIAAGLTGARRAELRTRLVAADPEQISQMVSRAREQMTKRTYYLADEATRAIKAELVKGIAVGDNPRRAASLAYRGIEDKWNGGLARARTIARTEMIDAHRRATQETEQANSDVLAGWEWVAHLGDDRTCRACLGMHGTVHKLSEFGPKGHPNCRCARVPKTKTWAELGFEGMREPASKTPDADQWFKALPESEQRKILTDKGYELWKQGKYPRSQWASRRKNDEWRDSYQPTLPRG